MVIGVCTSVGLSYSKSHIDLNTLINMRNTGELKPNRDFF